MAARVDDEGFVLFMPSAIDPAGCSFVTRVDPQKRRDDMRAALARWIREGAFSRMVLCEGSAWPASDFDDLVAEARGCGREVEILSFQGQGYPRTRGKGYGEMGIIAHALAHSRLMPAARHVFKITGRYYLADAATHMRFVRERPQLAIMCDLRGEMQEADARWFAATPAFLRERLLPQWESIDDSRNVFFEHVLARAAHAAMGAGERWAMPPRFPRLEGVSGTTGLSLGPVIMKRLQYPLRRRAIRY